MHKIFAKPRFLGKNIVFLPQCHSTNDKARSLGANNQLKNGSVVLTDFQSDGKGQQGNVWLSEGGKNLLFTLYLKRVNIHPHKQFGLNLIVSLALKETIDHFLPNENCQIKWPNDIYLNDKKVAGILIESVISKNEIEQCCIGIGLNVNQSNFELPNAISLFQTVQKEFDRNDILEQFLVNLEIQLNIYDQNEQKIAESYTENLFWKDQNRLFRIEDTSQSGIIRGIDDQGKLIVEINQELRTFNFKEIIFLQ